MTVEEYVGRFDRAVRDLPWRQRRDLVAELREHLAELPPDTDLPARLGPPDQYAAEMRAAAGLERRRGPIAYLRSVRPRNLVLITLTVTVIGLGIGTLAWISTYQPLQFGNATYAPGVHDSPAGDGSYYIFRQGKPFKYGITIWNSGRFTVRVVGVPMGFDFAHRIDYRVLMSGPTTYTAGGMPLPVTAFHPFDLKPGGMRAIYLSGDYGRCGFWKGSDGSAGGLDAFPVRYKFLWRTKTVSIPLPSPFVFVFKRKISCRSS